MKPATDITDFGDGGFGAMALPADALAVTVSPRLGARSRLSDFYELTKPRMNFLVVVTTLVGCYMAASAASPIHWVLLVNTILGTAATAAGASVLNQYVERTFDALMPRNRQSPLAGRWGFAAGGGWSLALP